MKQLLLGMTMVLALTGCRTNEPIPCQQVPQLTGMETARVVRVETCDDRQQCAAIIQRQNGDWAYVGVDGLIREKQLIFRACHLEGDQVQQCDPWWSNRPTMPHALNIDPAIGVSHEPTDAEL